MTLFRGRYRVEPARLPGWDYASSGCYFVTICTRERICFLGDVVNDEVRLSAAGRMVAEEWLKTAQLRHHVTLDAWVVMPNHFHAIVWIHGDNNVETHCHASPRHASPRHASLRHASPRHASPQTLATQTAGVVAVDPETHGNASLQSMRYSNSFGPQRNNLSSVIRGFKGASTTRIHCAGHPFAWQARFHDRIIRDEKNLAAIRAYIRDNPARWAMDREYRQHNPPAS